MDFYSFRVKTMTGEEISLAQYKEKVLLIVNTASKCGFTPQFSGLQRLYETYNNQGFEVLGFPCNQFGKQDPGSNEDILNFCQSHYAVTFPMFQKIEVKGKHAHPLFKYLTEQAKGVLTSDIKWNFTKFLIDRNGHVIARFAPQTKPEKIERAIEEALR